MDERKLRICLPCPARILCQNVGPFYATACISAIRCQHQKTAYKAPIHAGDQPARWSVMRISGDCSEMASPSPPTHVSDSRVPGNEQRHIWTHSNNIHIWSTVRVLDTCPFVSGFANSCGFRPKDSSFAGCTELRFCTTSQLMSPDSNSVLWRESSQRYW